MPEVKPLLYGPPDINDDMSIEEMDRIMDMMMEYGEVRPASEYK